ncbi:MAG: hypothetical protein Q8Q09_21630 [Deltaproteobacteria bacterium]|nr:hypothetical protein [Deltaproteobacteria bacterium]
MGRPLCDAYGMVPCDRSLAFLRRLALLGAAAAMMPACAVAEAQQLAPRPRPGRTFRVSRCPGTYAPGTSCTASIAPAGAGRATCTRQNYACVCRGIRPDVARWDCDFFGPNRGPLPPPDMPT